MSKFRNIHTLLLGGNHPTRLAVIPQIGARSAGGLRRQARLLEALARQVESNDERRGAVIKRVLERNEAFKIAAGMLGDADALGAGASAFLLDLVGSQQAYRKLASVLRVHFQRRILEPIERVTHMSEVALPKRWTTEYEVDDVSSDGPRAKKTISAWHVVDVEQELGLELAALGKRTAYGGRFVVISCRQSNEVVITFGGDRGGETMKWGAVVSNVERPQDPMNVRLLSFMRGAKDTRDVLEATALRPAFTRQINALVHKVVLHVATIGRRVEGAVVARAVAFVPKSLEVASSAVEVRKVELEAPSPRGPEADFSDCKGHLAVHEGFVVGVAVLLPDAADLVDSLAGGALDALRGRIKPYLRAPPAGACRVYVIPLAEPVPLGALLIVERLALRRAHTGDWAYFCMARGHIGSAATRRAASATRRGTSCGRAASAVRDCASTSCGAPRATR